MKNQEINKILINKDASTKEAMRIIDKGGLGTAFIIDARKRLLGVVTDGDIRSAILSGINIENPILSIANKKPAVIWENYTKRDLLKLKNDKKTLGKIPIEGSLKIPVLDKQNKIKDIIFLYADGNNFLQSSKEKSKLPKENIKRVLLTGGAGYLGSVLSRKLLEKGYNVRVLDNLTYGKEGIDELMGNKHFDFIQGDIRNISEVTKALEGVGAVIHLAAIVGDPASQWAPKETIEINYLSTKAIADACKYNQINKFLFTSTCSVYGASKTPNDRLTEESSLNPVSLYAETKLKSEEGILALADENFAPTIFRFGTLYGTSPRMRFDLVVNTLTAKALIEKEITIFGGEQWRPNLDVSDAAEACIKWIESPIDKCGGQIFNVGSNSQNYKIIEIGEIISKIISGTKIKIKKEKGDPRNYNISFDKITKMLSFKTRKTIAQSIREIEQLLRGKKIRNFNSPLYNNHRFLSKNKK